MKITIDPPLNQWRLGPPSPNERTELAMWVNSNSSSPGGAALVNTGRIVATGHQGWLWHPGILAKDIATAAAGRRFKAGRLHVVVDQDVRPALTLDLPVREGDRLTVKTLRLAAEKAHVPPISQPPADADEVVRALRDAQRRIGENLLVGLEPLIAAFAGLPPSLSLAHQIAAVTARLMQPWTGPMPLLLASQLAMIPAFEALVARMLGDARRCAAAYNRAVAAHPDARVAPLMEQIERVELPLWVLGWGQPRRRVFADLADSKPLLTLEDGQPIRAIGMPESFGNGDAAGAMEATPQGRPLHLAPRALMMTGVLRRYCCDLFIHGKGGGAYDRITEAWWSEWLGDELAPMAVVSADVRLVFDAPLTGRRDLERAVWWAHHLPHNVDRALTDRDPAAGEAELIERKRELLVHMDDDPRGRDRARRAAAFAEIHRINHELCRRHADLLDASHRRVDEASLGLANAAVAAKRDWCFALYPPQKLRELVGAIGIA